MMSGFYLILWMMLNKTYYLFCRQNNVKPLRGICEFGGSVFLQYFMPYGQSIEKNNFIC